MPTNSASTAIHAASPWLSPTYSHVSAPAAATTSTATNAPTCRTATARPIPTSAPIPSQSGSSQANPGVPRAAVNTATTVATAAATVRVRTASAPVR